MFKLLKRLELKELIKILFVFILVAFQVFLELKMPDYMSEITKLVQTKGSSMNDILLNGGYMLLCAFGTLVCAALTFFVSSSVSARFSQNIRKKLFDKVESFSTAEVKKFKISSLITRTTNDITHAQMFIGMGMQLLIKAPLTAVWAITKILNKSFEWSMITGGAVLILLVVIIALMFIVIPKFKIVQKLIDSINGVTRENLNGIRVIRAFNAEGYQEDKFEDVNNKLTKQQLFNQKSFAILSPVMNLILYGVTLLIYFTGSILIMNSTLSDKIDLFSNMIVFSSYAMQVIASFLMLAFIFMILPRASISANRINEVLETDISIKNGKFNGMTDLKGTVEFKNVSFKYPDAEEYLLEHISFKINKGETVAFIGSTGSGKSTLINLIPRFYDVTDGEILVDGINIKNYDLECLYNKLGYVSQKAVIFDKTVKENVSFGSSLNEKTDKDINISLEVAQASEFVSKMENKENSRISAGGTNISGGQKQRISIARAIARNPEIYIFDDSFSALDYKTDSVLRRELKKYTKDATSLIVAQRIGTIMHADKIIVLDSGKIVGNGTHKELLKNCEVYKEIALSQVSKEELYNE